MRLEITTSSECETIELGAALGATLRAGDVIAVSGELGAGKTRLARGVAIGLGLEPGVVSSPTYVLVNEYVRDDGAPPLVHVDAYRLRGAEDLASMGWEQVQDQDAITLIEWADRIADDLPASALHIQMTHAGGDDRRITMTGRDAWHDRLVGLPFQR